MVTKVEDDTIELTTAAIGKMKRRIADLLEPGETVNIYCLYFPGSIEALSKLSSAYIVNFSKIDLM